MWITHLTHRFTIAAGVVAIAATAVSGARVIQYAPLGGANQRWLLRALD